MAPWVFKLPPILFVFAVGACVGSFINVLVYRLPRGEGIFRPSSRCPACGTPLTWRENIPILGWVLLRGRCRFCRSAISPEYPTIELAMAVVFLGLLESWFPGVGSIGAWTGASAPDWAAPGLSQLWPFLMIVLTLVSCLAAMTLIDGRTFTIPLVLPWVAAGVAILGHPFQAWWSDRWQPLRAGAAEWPIPLVSEGMLGVAVGGGVGLIIAAALLQVGILPRSFADIDEWEAQARATPAAPGMDDGPAPPGIGTLLMRTVLFTGPAIALMAVGFSVGLRMGRPAPGMGVGMAIGLVIGAILRAFVPLPGERAGATRPSTPKAPKVRRFGWIADLAPPLIFGGAGATLGPGEAAVGLGFGTILSVAARPAPGAVAEGDGSPFWLAYPHARREVAKELLFIAPVLACAAAGWWLGEIGFFGDSRIAQSLGGSILGLLVGGAVVWAIRILASLAMGAEAMGLGDVHLMAAVGATLGWIDPLLAFLVAPIVALGWTVIAFVARGSRGAALPFGPHLAVATVAVMVGKPWFESLISALGGRAVDLP